MKNFKVLLFALVVGIFVSCTKSPDKFPLANIADTSIHSYKTDTVRYLSMNEETRLNGNVDFDQNSIVKIYSLVSGMFQLSKRTWGLTWKRELS